MSTEVILVLLTSVFFLPLNILLLLDDRQTTFEKSNALFKITICVGI